MSAENRLRPGRYSIERDNSSIGESFAIGNGIGQIVTVAERGFIWTVRYGGNDEVYIIEDDRPPRPGWYFENLEKNEPIILLPVKKEFSIVYAGEPWVYYIGATGGPLGVDWLVGVENDKDLVLKPFPVVPGQDRPKWRFKPVLQD